MPRLTGPPWVWKVVYDDGEVMVNHNVLGAWTGIYWALDRDGVGCKAETLQSALLCWWLTRRGFDVEIGRTKRKHKKED
jgi:hypothetical protein